MIVLPGYGKGFDVRQLSALWYRLEFLNVRSGGVSIIGLNVSQDDFIVESLFRYLLRGVFPDGARINILNPDPEVKQRFRDLLGEDNFSFTCDVFSHKTLEMALLK